MVDDVWLAVRHWLAANQDKKKPYGDEASTKIECCQEQEIVIVVVMTRWRRFVFVLCPTSNLKGNPSHVTMP